MSISIENVGIVLAVIGVVLLLVALIGGGVRIKEIDVPRIGAAPRVVISIFGLILLFVGVVLSFVPPVPPPPPPPPTPASTPGSDSVSTATPQSSSTWKAIINATDVSKKCGDYVAKSGYAYLFLDISLQNLSDRIQVLSADSFDLQDSSGERYSLSQCSNPSGQLVVGTRQSEQLIMVFLVPDVGSCFTLSIIDAEHHVSDSWSIGCKQI